MKSKLFIAGIAGALTLGFGVASASAADTVGLITKTETNPFFVKMREGATQKAKELGIEPDYRRRQVRRRQRRPGRRDREHDLGRRQGLCHRAVRLEGDRADHQEGARCGPDGHRARHAARSDGRGHATFATDNRKAGKLIGQWAAKHARRQGQGRQHRLPRSRHQPADRRLPARPGLHGRLRHRREGSEQVRRRGRQAHLHARNQPRATRPRAARRWKTRCRSART